MTFGEKLQELRRQGTMSQDALAEKLDVSRQAVSKWERDEAMPETDKIVRIAQLFGVSTDYLLLDRSAPEPERPPRASGSSGEFTAMGRRLERFVRRHGYKYGYVLIGMGVILCVMALMVMLLMPGFGSSLFEMEQPSDPAWGSGVYVEGNIPQDVLEELIGQVGSGAGSDPWSGPFGGLEQEYQQEVDKMQNAWKETTGMMAVMFGIPVMLLGIGLIILGTVIVVKGKRIAAQTER